MDAYPSVGGGGPVGWPRMNLEMHLHLNSQLASNEFLTELAFKIRKILSGFALVRQSREQATVGRTHASMSVGGHALPPHPLILKWLHPPPCTHTHTHTHTSTTPYLFLLIICRLDFFLCYVCLCMCSYKVENSK